MLYIYITVRTTGYYLAITWLFPDYIGWESIGCSGVIMLTTRLFFSIWLVHCTNTRDAGLEHTISGLWEATKGYLGIHRGTQDMYTYLYLLIILNKTEQNTENEMETRIA